MYAFRLGSARGTRRPAQHARIADQSPGWFMRVHFRSLALLAFIATGLAVSAARAETQCKDVPGIGPEIAKFLDEVGAAQAAGQGSLPLMDVLFGVTEIGADDRQALGKREAVQIVKRAPTG